MKKIVAIITVISMMASLAVTATARTAIDIDDIEMLIISFGYDKHGEDILEFRTPNGGVGVGNDILAWGVENFKLEFSKGFTSDFGKMDAKGIGDYVYITPVIGNIAEGNGQLGIAFGNDISGDTTVFYFEVEGTGSVHITGMFTVTVPNPDYDPTYNRHDHCEAHADCDPNLDCDNRANCTIKCDSDSNCGLIVPKTIQISCPINVTLCNYNIDCTCLICELCGGCRDCRTETPTTNVDCECEIDDCAICDCFMLGDINNDAKFNITDVLHVLMHLARIQSSALNSDIRSMNAARITNHDVKNGRIIITDALQMLMKLAKIQSSIVDGSIDGRGRHKAYHRHM